MSSNAKRMKKKNKTLVQVEDILPIVVEECAEVIQVIQKINRFGIDGYSPTTPITTNKDHLIEEVGDLLYVIGYMIERGYLGEDAEERLEKAFKAKETKLRKWSPHLYE